MVEAVLVGDLLEAAVAHADQPLMQDEGGLRLWRSEPRDEPVWIKRDRVGARIGNIVGDREHVVLVDRYGAGEHETLAIVVGESDRRRSGERSGRPCLPHRIWTRHGDVLAGVCDPAMLHVIRMR